MSFDAGARWPSKSKVRRQNVSLYSLELSALRLLAKDEQNRCISAAVARMIDSAMTGRYGDNWREFVPFNRITRDKI